MGIRPIDTTDLSVCAVTLSYPLVGADFVACDVQCSGRLLLAYVPYASLRPPTSSGPFPDRKPSLRRQRVGPNRATFRNQMAGDFGELVLVLGDMHIPHREAAIPEKFKKMLVPNKMQHVLCTGNLVGKDQYDDLRTLAPNVHVVRGDFEESTTFPETKVVQIGQFRVGLVHGHQIVPWGDPNALAMAQRQLGADILITGHTHRNQVNEFGGRWFINPGSITGAYSALETDAVPSFILLAVQGAKCVTYVYELHGDQVEVSKSEFSKAA